MKCETNPKACKAGKIVGWCILGIGLAFLFGFVIKGLWNAQGWHGDKKRREADHSGRAGKRKIIIPLKKRESRKYRRTAV